MSQVGYNFVFVGGSCGSFIKIIWSYYTHYIDQNKFINLTFNRLTGDAHMKEASYYRTFHTCSISDIKKKDPYKKIVLIMFDDEDLDLITKLEYFKYGKNWIENNLELAHQSYPIMAEKLLDPRKWQDAWQEHMKIGFRDWLQRIDKENADFVIDFKTIYRQAGNLNQLVANYLKTDPLPEVAAFIDEYRLVNYKLYGKYLYGKY
jgi:hypothetical protein